MRPKEGWLLGLYRWVELNPLHEDAMRLARVTRGPPTERWLLDRESADSGAWLRLAIPRAKADIALEAILSPQY